MAILEKWEKGRRILLIIRDSIKDLFVWLFVSFLLPLTQLLIIKLSKYQLDVDENVYNILFVTIASFLTGVFFVTDFWKKKRAIVRMMLVVSYLLSFGLFTISLIQVMFQLTIFDLAIYRWGVYIALSLAILVGFFSKYDENTVAAHAIIEQAKRETEGVVDGKPIKL